MMICGFLRAQVDLELEVTREYEEEGILFILKDLEKKYDIPFKYNAILLPEVKKSYSFQELGLDQVLRVIFDGTELSHFVHDDAIVILPKSMIARMSDQDRQIRSFTPAGTRDVDDSQKKLLLGTLMDSVSLEAVPSALLYISETNEFASTDDLGQFTLGLPEGRYEFEITSLTHEPKKFSIDISQDTSFIVFLQQRAYLIDEIVIQSRAQDFNIAETSTGLEMLSQRELKQLSSFMGENDVIQSVLTLAGVNTIGEGSTGYNVRGGSIDQNLVLQDGSLVYNPSHILGFFSSFNPDIVREVLLYKGHVPAQYGGRTSSVLDVIIKEPNDQRFRGNLNLGLVSSKLSMEVPIFKQKTALLLSGRTSYTSWFLKQIDNPDVNTSQARFYDMNAKLVHAFSENSKLVASYFQSFDKFNFADDFGYAWRNRIFNAQYRHVFSSELSANVQYSVGDIFNQQFEPTGSQAFELNSGIEYQKLSATALYNKGPHVLRAGIEILENRSKPEELIPMPGSLIRPNIVDKDHGREISFYVNEELNLGEFFSISAGLRFNMYQQIGPGVAYQYENELPTNREAIIDSTVFSDDETIHSYHSLEPRISLRWQMDEKSSVKLSYNRIAQFIHLVSNTATPTPIDIWQVSTQYLPPIRANNYSLGYYHNLQESQVELSFEAYYRKLQNTLDYKDFPDLLLNDQIETELLIGEGQAYGFEIGTQKMSGTLTGRASYSFARSLRKVSDNAFYEPINGGDWYPSAYDQPHTFKCQLNWQSDKRNSLHLNFIFSSGRPITAPLGNYRVQDVVVSHFSERNQFRIPDYHRLDVSYKIRLSRRSNVRFLSYLTVSIYNLYARKNAFSIYYRQNTNSTVNARKLSIVGTAIPSVNFSASF